MQPINETLAPNDLVEGIFGGARGYAPVRVLTQFATLKSIDVVAYALRKDDLGRLLQITNGSAVTITVRPQSEEPFPDMGAVAIWQYGAGLVTVAEGPGVTVRTAETLVSGGQYGAMTLIHISGEEWLLTGYLAAAA
jgi:hypothetical protein